jgi:PTH1 family peptidyl-tRNA hydrolase
MIIDSLAGHFNTGKFQLAENYIYSEASYKDKEIMLLKPVTFMNLSGIAVKEFVDKTNLPLQNIIVLSDDINLQFGTIRIRPSGSDGGQKGLASIIYELLDDNFPRLRFGIGNSYEMEKYGNELAEFVLSEFTPEEKNELDKLISISKDAVLNFLDHGISDTMNRFNKSYLMPPENTKENGHNDINLG